jgi:uncharacterized protein (TIGR03435 family)
MAGLARAQTFDAASIKPSSPQSGRHASGGPGTSDPTRYRFSYATLLALIGVAYDVDHFQISGAKPLDQNRFDLVANVPEGATREQFRAMMRNLLAERFHLKLHVESKEFPAYALVVAKGGLKIREVDADSPRDGFPDLPADRPGIAVRKFPSGGSAVVRIRARQEPLSVLAQRLEPDDALPVVDRTGLSGRYNFTFEFSEEVPGAGGDARNNSPDVPGLFTALQTQLGLRLERRKVPFDVLIVQSFDKTPGEN